MQSDDEKQPVSGANAERADTHKSTIETLGEVKTIDDKAVTRRTFIGFGVLGAGAIAAIATWKWIGAQPEVLGIQAPLRTALEKNGTVVENTLFRSTHLAPEYARSAAAVEPRINGDIGLESEFDEDAWTLQITAPHHAKPHTLTIETLQALPKRDIVFEFKCVEGWSEIQHWSGVRLADVLAHVDAKAEQYRYVGMATPDKEYYIGLDMASALHPQTILAYESNDMLIADDQGAPLRLIVPVKYGIKNIKRIGTITLTNERPADYWAERGYDYYAGL
jgi:DMSO/TMAO reductase YedYZ molybdopterin-dependent catalytic subunit